MTKIMTFPWLIEVNGSVMLCYGLPQLPLESNIQTLTLTSDQGEKVIMCYVLWLLFEILKLGQY